MTLTQFPLNLYCNGLNFCSTLLPIKESTFLRFPSACSGYENFPYILLSALFKYKASASLPILKGLLDRYAGIEPVTSAWKADMLPLH